MSIFSRKILVQRKDREERHLAFVMDQGRKEKKNYTTVLLENRGGNWMLIVH